MRCPTASCSLAAERRGECVRASWLYSYFNASLGYSYFCVYHVRVLLLCRWQAGQEATTPTTWVEPLPTMLPLPLLITAATAPNMFLLCFGFPVLPFRPWSYSVFSYCCSVLPATSPGGHDTSEFTLFYVNLCYFILSHFIICFFVPFVFLCQRIWIAINSVCINHMSCPVRRHVVPLSILITIFTM